MKVSERVLRGILWLLALDAAIGGAVLLFGGRAVFIWLFPFTPASEVSDLLLFRQKTCGGLGAALAIMLIAAARDPRRNSIIVWAIAVGLAVSGAGELLSVSFLGAARLFPWYTLVAHSVARIGIAAALACLGKRVLRDDASAR